MCEVNIMKFDRLRVLRIEDKEKIQNFETKKNQDNQDPLAFMVSWSAPWRDESLDHYLNLGWSMGFFNHAEMLKRSDLEGYVLVQPILFFRGLTQSLWIESIRADSAEVFSTLLEGILRVAKEKHLQQVFFHQSLFQDFESESNRFKIESLSEFSFVRTTRWQN